MIYQSKSKEELIKELQKLSEQQLNMSALIENTKDLIWSVDKEYRLIAANSIFIKHVQPLYGKLIEVGELLIDKDILPPELCQEWKKNYDRGLAGEQFSMELSSEVIGKQKHLEISYNPIYKSKEIIGVNAIGRDITAHKNIENALRNSELKFKSIFSEAPLAIESYNSEGLLLDANRACLDIFGIQDIEEIKGFKLFEDPNLSEESKRQVREGKSYQYETEFDFELVKKHKLYRTSRSGKCFLNILITPYEISGLNENGYLVHIEDISERKIAENILRLTQFSVDNSTDAVYWMGPDAKFIYVNNAAVKILGFSKEELLTLTVHDMNPDFPKEIWAKHWEELKEKKSFVFQSVNKRKDNSIFPVEITANFLQFGDREINCAIVKDISERNQGEKSLLEIKDLLNATQQLTKVGGWRYTLDGQIMFWTDEAYRIHELDPNDFGEDSNEHIELSVKCYEEKDRSIIMEAFQKCVEKGISYDMEFPFTTVKGNKIWIRTTARAELENNKVMAVTGNIMDITERKKAVSALKESEEKYRIFFENNDAIILFINPDNGKIIFSNEAAANYYGYSRKQLTSLNISEINTLSQEEIKVKMLDARKRKQNYFLLKHKLASGDIRDVEVYQSKLFLNDHDVFSIIVHDITDRKKVETNLKYALEKAEEGDRLKSAFLANMSHEIRTPMNGILGFADLLRGNDLTIDKQQKYIGIIKKSGARMLNIINDLIDISKVESGQMEVLISKINVNDQIEYIHTFFKPEVERKGMTLSYKISLLDAEVEIYSDREKIYAILTNLVKNAIKYSDKGSIEVGYSIKPKSQDSSSTEPVEVEFYVIDTGIGIPDDKKESIFNRFVQADITDTRALSGAGLGLSISKAYVELLGGKIWVESEDGVGSQFYFTIPINKSNDLIIESKKEESIIEPDVKIDKLKILIAEDEEESDLYLTILLNNFEKEILHAKTGIEALELCHKNPDIGLIMMDIRMPDMNGHEATRKIREFNKDVVIIAQTAFGLAGDREKALDAGCNDHIAKPIDGGMLLKMINKHFGKAES